jgi:hypothetical protein
LLLFIAPTEGVLFILLLFYGVFGGFIINGALFIGCAELSLSMGFI